MKGAHERLLRLEAARRPAQLGKVTRVELAADVARVLDPARPSSDRATVLEALLRRFDSGSVAVEDLARMGGVNIEVLRAVSRLEGCCYACALQILEPIGACQRRLRCRVDSRYRPGTVDVERPRRLRPPDDPWFPQAIAACA